MNGRCERCGRPCEADLAWTVRGLGSCCRGGAPPACRDCGERLGESVGERVSGVCAGCLVGERVTAALSSPRAPR